MINSGMRARLVGIMPAVVAMGITDKLKDAVVGAIEQIFQNIADAMSFWALWGIKVMLNALGSELLPKPETFMEGPLSVLFGANYGLSIVLIRGLVVIAVIVSIINVARQRRTEFASKVLRSAIELILLAFLFFPVYTMLLGVVQAVTQQGLALAVGSPDGNLDGLQGALYAALIPDGVALQLIAGLINGIVATAVITQVSGLIVVGVIFTLFYPLNFVLRPFGTIGINQFRFATAVIISIPLIMIVMALLLCVELLMIRGASTIAPFLGSYASLVLGLVFGVLLILTPFTIFMLTFTKISETIGNNETKINSGIDVSSMPTIDARQMREEESRGGLDIMRQFTTELPIAVASGVNDPATEAKELAMQIGLKEAAASGNPYVAAGALAFTAYKGYKKLTDSNEPTEGGES